MFIYIHYSAHVHVCSPLTIAVLCIVLFSIEVNSFFFAACSPPEVCFCGTMKVIFGVSEELGDRAHMSSSILTFNCCSLRNLHSSLSLWVMLTYSAANVSQISPNSLEYIHFYKYICMYSSVSIYIYIYM